MGVPTPTAIIGTYSNGRNSQDDFLQLKSNMGGDVFAWIDYQGNLLGQFAASVATPPGGPTDSIQINNAGAFYGDSGFVYVPTVSVTISSQVPATSGANQSSPVLNIQGSSWTGSAATPDYWSIQNVIGTGSDPQSQLTIEHTGPGTAGVTLGGTLSTGNIVANEIDAEGHVSINSPAASSGGNVNSFPAIFNGAYWTGSASANDNWSIENVLGTGTNPASALTFTHTGATGGASINFTGANFSNIGTIQTSGITSAGNINILNGNSINTESSNAAMMTVGQSSELVTLSLVSAHTDSTTNLLPANAIIDSVVIYIVQTISGGSTPTTIAVGDDSTSNRFISTGTPLTAGSSAVGLNQIDAGASSQASAAHVRITLDQIPGQGQVRVTTFWRSFSAPTS